ncbi:hypothetical protein Q9L58_004206 [Maublancomyces gigas]|uniref:Uncharacterized protein n=1 Tax=Discina gigas TaxID=1032678 RepID=A0ABR3GLW8_9PEZI
MNADVTRILSILAQTASQQPPQPPHALPPPDPRLQHLPKPPQNLADPAHPVSAPPVDPKTITDWPTALRFVVNTLGKDEAVMAQIKKMKKHQHDHEKQWWAAREEIVRKHEARVESSQKVQDLLWASTPESEQDELRTFDQKVHLRSTDMVAHMASEFAQMGIPFFCRGALPDRPDAELQELRKRIVELLEDLCEG